VLDSNPSKYISIGLGTLTLISFFIAGLIEGLITGLTVKYSYAIF
jgi:uncharacterized membrane protein SpoIIM required for sporulation